MMEIRGHEQADVAGMAQVWNEVIEGGTAFPQEEKLDETAATAFFADICPYYRELD